MAKRKRRRKNRRASRLPLILLVLLMAGVAGLVVVSTRITQDSSSPESSPAMPDSVVPTDSSDASDPSAGSTDTIGTVAPPVTVQVTTEDSNHDGGAVLEDYQPVDAPVQPSTFASIPPNSASNDRIKSDLPDGSYLGYPDIALQEDSRFISWRIGSQRGPAYPALIEYLVYASLAVDARRADHPGSVAVLPETLWQLIASGQDTQLVPDSDDVMIIQGPYILTVNDGRVVAAEGIRIP